MKKTTIISIFLLLLSVMPAVAQSSNEKYVWEYLSPKNIANADDLKTKLETEVQKITTQNTHLAPFKTEYGEGAIYPRYSWYDRYDMIYTLSVAYPHLSSGLQTQVKSYLTKELTDYPIWGGNPQYLDEKTGTRRESYQMPINNYTTSNASWMLRNKPELFGVYALWVYAQNTNNWAYISTNWTTIKNYYNGRRGEVSNYYSALAGAIGMARLAQHQNDTAMMNTAVSDALAGITAGKSFATHATRAEDNFIDPADNWMKNRIWSGFTFFDISPEIGRYFKEDQTLRNAIIGDTSSRFTMSFGDKFYPLWYMAQPPLWSGYHGEGMSVSPHVRNQMFPLKAWMMEESATKLRLYVDVPDALLGDLYYIQNLAHVINAHGVTCWKDFRLGSESCGAAPSTQPQPSASPATKKGDVNGDGTVNSLDLKLILTNFGQLAAGVSGYSDPFADNKVNLLDAGWVIGQWGQ